MNLQNDSEAAVLYTLYFQWCTLNVNKIDVIKRFF